jgi:Laminin G domain
MMHRVSNPTKRILILIFQLVKLVIDRCLAAKITENDHSSSEDRRPCEATGQTPGDSELLNVMSPLQLGGRVHQLSPYPTHAGRDGFNGCIKNLFHNNQVVFLQYFFKLFTIIH